MKITSILFVGTICYALLWFSTFKDHDYYTLNLYILIVFILLNFFVLIKENYPFIFNSVLTKGFFFIFLLFNVHHAHNQIQLRYYGWWTEHKEYQHYHTIKPYLSSIGIHSLDTVICLPDNTHFTLYLMNLRGWTSCLGNNNDSIAIQQSINRGAKYLIDDFLSKDYLKNFLQHQIGEYHTIKIFELKDIEPMRED